MKTDAIDRDTLAHLAGTAAFQRGTEYFASGAVVRLRVTNGKVSAGVDGSERYEVELWSEGGELAYRCSCPRAADGYFCKHCVAVGLAWLAENAIDVKSGKASAKRKRRDPWRAIKEHLAAQSPDALIELLLEVAQRDDRLYQSLLLSAECRGASADIEKAFRRAIDGATRTRGFIDWREVDTFAAGIAQLLNSLTQLLRPDSAAILAELTEYAIESVESALEQVDDSNGVVGEIVYGLGQLHLDACAMACPEPAELAERLFHLETMLPFGLCSFDANTYRHILGVTGLQRYRELAQVQWRKIAPLTRDTAYDAQRWRITRIMEKLAQANDDVDELVAIKSRDLSAARCYLDIAEIWAKAERADKALEWAERGLDAFPGQPDNRLRDFLVAAYLKLKRNDEALQLTWIQFEELPTLGHYKKLHDIAGQLGVWPGERERALEKVAATIGLTAMPLAQRVGKPAPGDYSLRLEIALWEQDIDAACAAAQSGSCNRDLLIALAGALAASRPDEAISLYRRIVPSIIEQTSNRAYEEAIRLIRKMADLMKATDQTRQFGDYLRELRLKFKPKRNFIKLLDEVMRRVVA